MKIDSRRYYEKYCKERSAQRSDFISLRDRKIHKGFCKFTAATVLQSGSFLNTCLCKVEYDIWQNLQERPFAIDHCHKTGVVRGLLCDRCNSGLGALQDSSNILQEAVKYLEFPRETPRRYLRNTSIQEELKNRKRNQNNDVPYTGIM
jgi:hypothetical protein